MEMIMSTPVPQESGQASADFKKRLQELMEQVHALGHAQGFVAGFSQEYHLNDERIARLLSGIFSYLEGILKKKFNDEIILRYACDSKHMTVGIAITMPEDSYIVHHEELYRFLFEVEKVTPNGIPQLSGYLIDASVVTFSSEIPIDWDALNYDYPFTPQAA